MAVGKIANLSVGVSLDAAEFTNGLSKSQQDAQKWNDSLAKGAALTGAAIGAGLVAGLALFTSRLNEAADAMDAFNDLKDATGASIENISALDSVARRTGTTFESVESILVKFNKALGEARDNNGAGDALKALGLNAEELKRIDPAEALRQTAVALAGFADDANKARIIQELFGKSVKEAAPFLKDLSEQGSLVAKTTEAQAQAAEDYNKAIFEFKAAATDFQRSVTASVLPSITATIHGLADAKASALGFWDAIRGEKEKVETTFTMITKTRTEKPTVGDFGRAGAEREYLQLLDQQITKTKELTAVQRVQADIAEGKLTTASKEVQAEALAKAAVIDKHKAQQEAAAGAERADDKASAAADRMHKQATAYVDGLKRQIEQTQELSRVEQVLRRIQEGRFAASGASLAGKALDAAESLDLYDKIEKEHFDFEGPGLKILDQRSKDMADEAARLINSLRTPLDEYNAGLARTQALYDANLITSAQMTAANEKLGKTYRDQLDTFTEFSKQAQRNIQDALGDTLEDVLSGNFDNIGKKWAALLLKMSAQAAAAQLNEKIFGPKLQGGGWLTDLGKLLGIGGGSDPSAAAGAAELFKEFGTTTLAAPATPDGGGSSQYKRVAAMANSYKPEPTVSGITFDYTGQTINVGEGVSMSQVAEAVERGTSRSEANIRRSLHQQRVSV